MWQRLENVGVAVRELVAGDVDQFGEGCKCVSHPVMLSNRQNTEASKVAGCGVSF